MKKDWLVKRVEKLFRPPSYNLHIDRIFIENAFHLMLTKNTDPKILDVGAGDRRIHRKVVCMDIHRYENIDIIGDACDLPIRSESLDGIFMTTAMEYVDRPTDVVNELYRALKPGGYIYVSVPFLYPFLEDPDKFRFTPSGVSHIFSVFERIESGFSRGPSSTMVPIMANYFAILFSFNSDTIYRALARLFRWFLSPSKYLDLIVGRYYCAKAICSAIYFIGRKAL